MLRVTIHDGSKELRIRLEGRLAGPWVREVETCWEQSLASAGRRALIVDLRNVDFVDAAGERLLACMHRHGARLIACGAMMSHVVFEIAGCGEAGGPAVDSRSESVLNRRGIA